MKVLSDIVLVREDSKDIYSDDSSGLTSDVSKALKDGKLIVPDAYEDFSKKYPCRGKVLAIGNDVKGDIKIGDRVIFARLGGMRFTFEGEEMVSLRQKDIIAIII